MTPDSKLVNTDSSTLLVFSAETKTALLADTLAWGIEKYLTFIFLIYSTKLMHQFKSRPVVKELCLNAVQCAETGNI